MRENKYQLGLIQKLHDLIPECFILKNDSGYLQGVPDIIILYQDRWAMLEVKRDSNAEEQPNQRYYVNLLSTMSFASFIDPSTEEEVLYELQRSFGLIR